MLALPVLAVAAAAALPSTTTPGVTATRSSGGRVTIRFADNPTGQKAYRRFAGRRVTIRCQHVGSDLLYGSGATDVVTTRARFGRTLSTITLRIRGTTNLCSLGSPFGGVVVATDTAGRRFLADLGGFALLDVAAQVERKGATATLRSLKSLGVRLSNSAATPHAGRVGIFGDRGGTAGAVLRSASGRRLFAELSGDTLRSNILGTLDQLTPARPAAAALPTGARPAPGTALPASTDPEVSATRDGRAVSIAFTGSARTGLAGAPVSLSCSRQSNGGAIDEGFGSTESGPPAGQPLREDVDPAFHLCAVSFRGRTVRLALDGTGRAQLEEATVAAGLDRVLHNAGSEAGYPSGETLSARYRGDVVALPAATAASPDLRIGAWSDGKRRLVLTAVARTGRRLFIEVDGQVVRTNVFNVPPLPGP
jgi:hypothetical protein